VARQLVDAVASQDLARLIELTDPKVEWNSFFAQLQQGGVYRGHDGIRQYAEDLRETFELLRTDIIDTLCIGAVVLMVGRLRYRGKGGGVESESLVGYLLQVRRGRAVLMRAFREPEEALEAVGLRE
jgi:ketosteroid isomerase-like protein